MVNREAWHMHAVNGVSKSWTRLSNWTSSSSAWQSHPLPSPLGMWYICGFHFLSCIFKLFSQFFKLLKVIECLPNWKHKENKTPGLSYTMNPSSSYPLSLFPMASNSLKNSQFYLSPLLPLWFEGSHIQSAFFPYYFIETVSMTLCTPISLTPPPAVLPSKILCSLLSPHSPWVITPSFSFQLHPSVAAVPKTYLQLSSSCSVHRGHYCLLDTFT